MATEPDEQQEPTSDQSDQERARAFRKDTQTQKTADEDQESSEGNKDESDASSAPPSQPKPSRVIGQGRATLRLVPTAPDAVLQRADAPARAGAPATPPDQRGDIERRRSLRRREDSSSGAGINETQGLIPRRTPRQRGVPTVGGTSATGSGPTALSAGSVGRPPDLTAGRERINVRRRLPTDTRTEERQRRRDMGSVGPELSRGTGASASMTPSAAATPRLGTTGVPSQAAVGMSPNQPTGRAVPYREDEEDEQSRHDQIRERLNRRVRQELRQRVQQRALQYGRQGARAVGRGAKQAATQGARLGGRMAVQGGRLAGQLAARTAILVWQGVVWAVGALAGFFAATWPIWVVVLLLIFIVALACSPTDYGSGNAALIAIKIGFQTALMSTGVNCVGK